MPNRPRGRRVDPKSRALKARIVRLRKKGLTIPEISRRVGVSRQYVSAVLIEAGLRSRARVQVRTTQGEEIREAEATIDKLRQQGEYGLADLVRAVVERRGGDPTSREARLRGEARGPQDEPGGNGPEARAVIARLEEQGDYSLASLLRAVKRRGGSARDK